MGNKLLNYDPSIPYSVIYDLYALKPRSTNMKKNAKLFGDVLPNPPAGIFYIDGSTNSTSINK